MGRVVLPRPQFLAGKGLHATRAVHRIRVGAGRASGQVIRCEKVGGCLWQARVLLSWQAMCHVLVFVLAAYFALDKEQQLGVGQLPALESHNHVLGSAAGRSAAVVANGFTLCPAVLAGGWY